MKRLIFSALLAACGSDESVPNSDASINSKAPAVETETVAQDSVTNPEQQTDIIAAKPKINSLYIATAAEMPACTPDAYRQLIFVAEDDSFYTCADSWQKIDIRQEPTVATTIVYAQAFAYFQPIKGDVNKMGVIDLWVHEVAWSRNTLVVKGFSNGDGFFVIHFKLPKDSTAALTGTVQPAAGTSPGPTFTITPLVWGESITLQIQANTPGGLLAVKDFSLELLPEPI